MNQGCQSESTDGLKGNWSRVVWSGCGDCSGHPELLDVVWRSADVAVVVVYWSCSCGVVQVV